MEFDLLIWKMGFGQGRLESGVREFNKGNIHDSIQRYSEALAILPDNSLTLDLRTNLLVRKGCSELCLGQLKNAALSFGDIPDCIEITDRIVYGDAIRDFLIEGHSFFQKGDFETAFIYYNALKKIGDQRYVKTIGYLGATIAKFKTERRPLSYLSSSLKGTFIACFFPEHAIHEVEKMAYYWVNKALDASLEQSIDDLNIANIIVEAFPLVDNKLVIQINKNLLQLLYKKNKKDEARKKFAKLIALKSNFLEEYLQSEREKAVREEKSGNLESAAECLRLLSFLICSTGGNTFLRDSVKTIIQLHYQLFNIEKSTNNLNKSFEALENLCEFLQEYEIKDERTAIQLKENGNFFLKNQEYNSAKQLYSYGLRILPYGCEDTQKILLSNRSHVELLLKNYDRAISDAKSCIDLSPGWPKGHLRLGRSCSETRQFLSAHKSFLDCYKLASEKERLEVLKNIFINVSSAVNEKDQRTMPLPDIITAELVNKCIELLCCDSSSSSSSFAALAYIFTNSKFATIATAENIPLTKVIQNKFSEDCVKLLLDHGADPNMLEGDVSPLQAAINENETQSKSIVHFIQKGAKVNAFISEIKDEPASHTFLRLCIGLGKEDLFERALNEIDLNVVDARGNTLLHILAKENISKTVICCLSTILKKFVVDPDIRNKDTKKAIDLLANHQDERRKLINDYENSFLQNGKRSCKKKKKKKKKKNHQSGYDELAKNEETEQEISASNEWQEVPLPRDADNESIKQVDTAESSKFVTRSANPNEEIRKKISECIKNFVSVDISELIVNERMRDVSDDTITPSCPTGNISPMNNDIENQESTVLEIIELDEDELVDFDGFEGLPWDVQCTSEFWKKLKDNKLEGFIKKKILKKIQFLAAGDWRKELAVRLQGAWKSTGIRLYEAKLDKGARILWEEAVAFSERCSMSSDETSDIGKSEERFIYTDVIRLWDFTLDHDEVPHLIDRIVQSRIRGQSCTIKKKLKSIPLSSSSVIEKGMRVPKRYVVDNEQYNPPVIQPSDASNSSVVSWKDVFFPSASPNEREYHILKFYALSSSMANSVLLNCDQNFDFPFQVSELEHFIIRLRPSPLASVLLLGRSGTGKTTCCLYRLWSKFKTYWERATTAGPHIPVLQRLIEPLVENDDASVANNQSENFQETLDKFNVADDDRVMSCGCRGKHCLCAIAAFKAASDFVPDISGQSSDISQDDKNQDTESDDVTSSDCSEENEEDSHYRHLRQLFITKNKVLCHEVKRNFQDLCRAVPETKQRAEHSAEVNASNLNKLEEYSFPLFLGSRDLLVMLDATLPGQSFFVRDSSGKLLNQVPGWGENEGHLSFLPTLDSEDEDDSENEGEETTNETAQSRLNRQMSVGRKEVTYAVFSLEIWPTIERKFKSSYHPSLVWTEIRSFIKGTVQALLSEDGFMSKDDYESVGRKKAPSFSGNRSVIYQMFRIYEKIRKAKNMFDEFDLLYNVYQRLSRHPLQEWLFDEIYVDETQDFTEAELFTLIRCCQNPNQLFFTGDTAQSIMRGVAFRFSDLRSLFYNAKTAFAGKKGSFVVVPDQVHQLTYNYRSHKGILNLATSVVKLLGHFFPESFDKLENDVGLFDGPKPVILETSDFSDLALLLSGARRKTSPIEFGAHQVVIVSSEESKSHLPEELSCALVLSIYEAKGLEFDDVLLYNFFRDSQARDEWRVVNTYTDPSKSCSSKQESLYAGVVRKTAKDLEQNLRPLEFDYSKHKILNSELKQLYTALTRARVNVWIYDEDRENRAPMFDYFKREELVNILRLDQTEKTLDKGMFAEESSLADWQKQGMFFYKKELWRPAFKCFQRTQNKAMLERCSAHLQALKAYQMGMEWREQKSFSLKNVHNEYVNATLKYLKCGMGDEALICLKNAKEWQPLADLFNRLGKYYEAGRYYRKAGLPLQAAECYEKNGDFRNAVDLLYSKEYFTYCIEVLKRYEMSNSRGQLRFLRPPRSTTSLKKVAVEAADLCRKRRQFDSMEKFLNELPLEDQLQYLQKPDCEDVLLDVLTKNKRIEDVVKIHMDKGRYLEAAALTSDKETKGLCHLEHAFIVYRKWALKKKKTIDLPPDCLILAGESPCPDSLIRAIEECVLLLPDNSTRLANAFEIQAFAESNASSCMKALNLFIQTRDHFAALLCHTFLLEIGEGSTEGFAGSINKVYRLIGQLLHTESGVDNQMIRAGHSFFGVEEDKESGYAVNLNTLQYRVCLINKQLHIANEIKNAFTNSDVKFGNRQLAMLMLGFVNRLSTKLRDLYEHELVAEEICDDFLHGIKHEDCDRNHFVPDSERAQRRLNAFFAIIQLDGVTRSFIAHIRKKDKSIMEYLPECSYLSKYLSDKDMLNVCHAFYDELIGYTYHLLPGKFTGISLSNCIPEMPFVKEQILWYVRSIWESSEDAKKFGDMNLFLKVSILSNFASVSYSLAIVDKIREEIKSRYQESIPPNEGAIYNNRSNVFESFHTIFADSKTWLHQMGALVESTHHLLRRTIVIPLRSNKSLPLLELINTITFLEFNVAVCMVALTFLSTRSNTKVVMPGYYFESIEFWSALYTKCQNGYSAIESVEYVTQSYLMTNLLREIVDLIVMEKYEKFDLFAAAFGKDGIKTQAAERFFVLILVLMANYNLIGLKDEKVESMLNHLKYFAGINAEGQDRLSLALQKFINFQGTNDARDLLRWFLDGTGNVLLQYTWTQISKKYLQGMNVFKNRKDWSDTPKRVTILAPAKEEKEIKFQPNPKDLSQQAVHLEEKKAHRSHDGVFFEYNAEKRGEDDELAADGTSGWQFSEETGVAEDRRLAMTQHRTLAGVETDNEDIDEEVPVGIRNLPDLATSGRQEKQREAAYVIQRWWREIIPTIRKMRRSGVGGLSGDDKILNDHRKYVHGLTCKPCGKTFDSKTAVESHILEETMHKEKAKAFDIYQKYENSVLNVNLKLAEDILDREIQSGQKASELDCALKLEQCLSDVTVARSLIENSRKWTVIGDLKAYVETLEKACRELEDELYYIEHGKNYEGEHQNYQESFLTEDDFQLVTKKKRRNDKSSNKRGTSNGGKGRGKKKA